MTKKKDKGMSKKEIALAAGVRDVSYSTVRYGWVKSYSGQATVTLLEDNKTYRAIGHRSTGAPEGPVKDGFIEFMPIEEWVEPTPHDQMDWSVLHPPTKQKRPHYVPKSLRNLSTG